MIHNDSRTTARPPTDNNPLKRALKKLDELTPTITAGYRGKFNVIREMEAMREERDKEIEELSQD